MPDHPVVSTALPVSRDAMAEVARRALATAARLGASDAEVEISAAVGQSVTVRRGEVETVEYNRDKGLAITVFMGQRRGNASTSDFSADAIRQTAQAAFSQRSASCAACSLVTLQGWNRSRSRCDSSGATSSGSGRPATGSCAVKRAMS